MTGRASRRALAAIAVTLTLAVTILIIATVLDSLPGAGRTASAPSTSSLPGTDATPGDSETPSPSRSTTPDSSTGKSGTGSASDRTSSEVLSAPEEKSPIGLPPSPPLPGLVTLPLPETASATGALVAGFPAVIPLSQDAAVVSSSVASAENRLQVTLAAETPATSDSVLEFYRVAFAATSLVDSVAPAAAGSQALLFSRGADTVLLTVTPVEAGGTAYSLFGAFTAAK